MNQLELGEAPVPTALERPAVLCVDDEASILSSLRRLLGREELEVLATPSPQEALQWVEERNIAVLITDYRMPDMTGVELVRTVQGRRPNLPCLLLTAYPNLPEILDLIREGGLGLVSKPWVDEDLRQQVRWLIDRPGGRSRAEGRGTGPQRRIWSSPDIREVLVVLDAAGARAGDLLDRLEDATDFLPEDGSGWVIALRGLSEMDDSLLRFYKLLANRIGAWGIPTSIIDRPGEAGGILEMVGASGPIAILGRSTPHRPPQRVFLLESGRETSQYLCTLIRAAGHQCEARSAVRPPLEESGGRNFDLALLDLAIPEGGAIALSQTLRQSHPGLPIVALTHGSRVWDGRTLAGLGFSRSLEKPYSVRNLLDLLEHPGNPPAP